VVIKKEFKKVVNKEKARARKEGEMITEWITGWSK
jgi:hypothetical protein